MYKKEDKKYFEVRKTLRDEEIIEDYLDLNKKEKLKKEREEDDVKGVRKSLDLKLNSE